MHTSMQQPFGLSLHSLWLRENVSVAIRIGETPVPIPNTMVKTYPAENTAWATVWEGRWLPNYQKSNEHCKSIDRRLRHACMAEDLWGCFYKANACERENEVFECAMRMLYIMCSYSE